MTDWASIIQEYTPLVWKTAYRLLNHDADARDCLQQTFLSAVVLDSSEKVLHWPAVLQRLATARAIEQLRSRYRQRGRFQSLEDESPDAKLDVFQHAVTGELNDRLREALSTIESQQAKVFCLVCLEGMSNVAAAEQLGMTAAHVGVVLQRARENLRRQLRAFAPSREDLR